MNLKDEIKTLHPNELKNRAKFLSMLYADWAKGGVLQVFLRGNLHEWVDTNILPDIRHDVRKYRIRPYDSTDT